MKKPSSFGQLDERTALLAPDFYPALRAATEEIAALDLKVQAHRERQAAIDAQLNRAEKLPGTPASPVDVARQLLRPEASGPAMQTAAQLGHALREEFTRLRDEIDLLQRARGDMVSRANLACEKATAERRALPDVASAAARLAQAAADLLEAHRAGQELVGRLQKQGFNMELPHGWSGAELPSELVPMLEQVAAGGQMNVPFLSYWQKPTPYVDRGIKQRRVLYEYANV